LAEGLVLYLTGLRARHPTSQAPAGFAQISVGAQLFGGLHDNYLRTMMSMLAL
jgi:hypothetical protein